MIFHTWQPECWCSAWQRREIVETLNRIKIDICCVQEVRWRGASTRTATRKNSHYKLFWIGNKTGNGGVGIFVEKIEKVLEVKHVNDRLMMVKPQTYKRTAVQFQLMDFKKDALTMNKTAFMKVLYNYLLV